jgi:hypothetical protein
LKIYQAYYDQSQESQLSPSLIPLNTQKLQVPLLEYDIFRHLRPEGDFGMVSWKFARKTRLMDWEDKVRDKLKEYDAVIINPFPGIEAVSYNCWETHQSLKPFAGVDTDVFQRDMAFCSYIFAKRIWWDKYFAFMEERLKNTPNEAFTKSAGYGRNADLNCIPFLIERWLNYTLEGAYMWEYPVHHYILKFGNSDLYDLKQMKGKQGWHLRRTRFDLGTIAQQDDRS